MGIEEAGMTIFVDSSMFVSLNNPEDSNFQVAHTILAGYNNQGHETVTTNYIVAESLTMIAQKASLERAVRFRETLRDTSIVRVDEKLEEEAFEIFKNLTSKNVSFVDCTSFALMRSLGITAAFSFDEHFKQFGFRLLK